MKSKVRVDLSKLWRYLLLGMCLSILGGLVMKHLAAQMDGRDGWRHTVRGWEYAHSVQTSSTPAFLTSVPREPSALSSVRQWHRIALPLAVSSFLVTFGCWVLLEIPNRGIIRRLGD